MTEESKEMDINKKLLSEFEAKREKYLLDIIKYKAIYDEDHNNDYPFFLYLASIMNFVESHNDGCLTTLGMKSLELDISYIIKQLNDGYEINQKDLVRFSLNILDSYATCILVVGLFEFSKEMSSDFFNLNPFPTAVRDDFDQLQKKCLELIPQLKNVLDVYTLKLNNEMRKLFNQEKTKAFVKKIFDETAIKIGSVSSGIPSSVKNAKCMN
jgi:hypothetical protein